MASYSVTLTNPGAETGNITGWVDVEGGDAGYSAAHVDAARTGTYGFRWGTHPLNNQGNHFYTQATIDPARYAVIDDNGMIANVSAWQRNDGDNDSYGRIYIEFFDGTSTLISSATTTYISTGVWTERTISTAVPSGTRMVRLHNENYNNPGASTRHDWDDFSITLDEVVSTGINDYQLGAYAVGSYYSAGVKASQFSGLALVARETSSGLHIMKTHQLGAYALAMGFPDRRDLRAWTFTQDDHDFYVVNLGVAETLVYDKLTQQWAQWKSPNYEYWRTEDGTDWEGINVACDPRTGKLWKIDPTYRLDYGTTPIESVVTGMVTNRMRKHAPVYMGELAISEGTPPVGIDAGTVGISLRTFDQSGNDIVDHGTIVGEDIGDDITVRWYGLGLMKSPGHVFQITDTGYARRIDGFDIEVGTNG